MDHSTGNFKGTGSQDLFYQVWKPDTAPRAALAIVHGVGEHSGRYANLVNCLVPAGFALAGYDHRGHGRSPGQRGHINSWAEFHGDLDGFLAQTRQLFPGLPLFLYGHSMGSLVVLEYVLRKPQGLNGVILSGTGLLPGSVASKGQIMLAKLMSRLVPTFKIEMPIAGDELSRDPQIGKAYQDDPLVHPYRSARWGTEILAILEWIKSHAADLMLPVLFIHGEDDPLVLAEGARRFYANISSTDKTLLIYPGDRHECHHELDYQKVMFDLSAWLEKRINNVV